MTVLLTSVLSVGNGDCRNDIFLSHVHSPPSISWIPRVRTRGMISVIATVYCSSRWSDVTIMINALERWTIQQNVSCKKDVSQKIHSYNSNVQNIPVKLLQLVCRNYHTRPCAYQWFQGCACKVCETHRLKVNSHCDTALFISMYDITMVQP